MKNFLKAILPVIFLFILWQIVVVIFDLPHYILPKPKDVFLQLINQYSLLWEHTQTTLLEIVIGLILGCFFGLGSAFALLYFKKIEKYLLPILVISQAIPVFAIAPLLVLWFGYGLASKIVMTVLIIYFPITTACYDGLKNTPKQWLQLAHTYKLTPLQILFKVRFKASLPSLASGFKIAVCIAPLGAVIGEWIGSSKGLGYLMLHANARMQIDLMFSALFILIILTLSLYFLSDYLTRKFIPWASYLH
ncbi:MAG: ABC transporter permease [Aliarcobacter sp.]|jgi:putative hydroxymethylpyrimidine transport system permease protein|nr:ABC transporter permease [Aliarcobacter sp.]